VGDHSPVRRAEYGEYKTATNHRLEQLERWREAHERAHDDDDDDDRDDRRWSWQQIAAWAAVAAVLAAAWLSSAGAR